MKSLNFLSQNWRLLLAALTAAGIVHICTTLATVHYGEVAGYTLLAAQSPANQINYLPEVTPQNQSLPFLMPDTRYAVCRFDASNSTVHIRAELPEPGWSLSMHAPNGDNFLFVAGTIDRTTKINIVVNPRDPKFEAKTLAELPEKKKSPVITIKREHGIAIFKAPINALAFRRLADEQLNLFECYEERRKR